MHTYLFPPGIIVKATGESRLDICYPFWLPSCRILPIFGRKSSLYESWWETRISFPPQVENAKFQILVFPASLAARMQTQDTLTANLTHFPDSASLERLSDAEGRSSRASFPGGLAATARSYAGVGCVCWQEQEFRGRSGTLCRPPPSLVHQPFWRFCDPPNILFCLHQPDGSCVLLLRPLTDIVSTYTCMYATCMHTSYHTHPLPPLHSLLYVPWKMLWYS